MQYGQPVDAVWEIPRLNNSDKERLGYTTQKPIGLLERTLKACSDEDDWVLDPFCGCGTAIVVEHSKKYLESEYTFLLIKCFIKLVIFNLKC
jgi:DNA methylase